MLPLAAMTLLAASELVLRALGGTGVPGAGPLVQHLTLWLGFLGAAVAARDQRLLSLATTQYLPEGALKRGAGLVAGAVGAAVAALLAVACWQLVEIDREAGGEIALGIPIWVGQLVMPVALAAVALRLAWWSDRRWAGRVVAAAALGLGLLLAWRPEWSEGASPWIGLAAVTIGTLAGGPLFAALGGAAVWLFLADGVPIAAVPADAYRLAVHPTLPSIPLFTLAGFLLAEGKAALRLLDLFRALVGWLPGGSAVVAAVLCAFFTTFTGGSGVTILALGALLLQALSADRYRERFSLGLITSSGSLGLMFPPAVPLIFYGIVANVAIPELFKGGLLPGLLAVAATAAYGVVEGRRTSARQAFSLRRLGRAVADAKWELSLPVLVVGLLFSGWATIVEAAAAAALWAGVVQMAIHREIPLRRLPAVLLEATVLIGGVLLILCAALGLTSWLVDAQVPLHLLAWARETLSSKWAFLLMLNLLLIAVGCLMDVFSAIAVMVPLIAPLGLAFGVDPIHLGIIFIANLELGFLTPPVGVNLFLASYRFDKPILEVTRAVLPWLAIRAAIVLLITYVPFLTLALLDR
ncbi:MAG TPA: TRAP transporter large permease subunit [Thermoanaerobaculia bacterium]|nr:TRAP transporter large permease subunit [Thermoanaerobaculia bacterium]